MDSAFGPEADLVVGLLEDKDFHAGAEAGLGELGINGWGLVLDVLDAEDAVRGCGWQSQALVVGEVASGKGDRVAVRVAGGVAELGGEGIGLLGGEEVFLPFGLGMPVGLAGAGLIGEVALPESMGADDMEGEIATFRFEGEVTLGVGDERLTFHLIEQLGGLVGFEVEGTGDAIEVGVLAFGFEFEEVFEGVFLVDAPVEVEEALPARAEDG